MRGAGVRPTGMAGRDQQYHAIDNIIAPAAFNAGAARDRMELKDHEAALAALRISASDSRYRSKSGQLHPCSKAVRFTAPTIGAMTRDQLKRLERDLWAAADKLR